MEKINGALLKIPTFMEVDARNSTHGFYKKGAIIKLKKSDYSKEVHHHKMPNKTPMHLY